MTRYIKYWILLVALCLKNIYAPAYPHPGGMHPQKQIEFVKEQIKLKNQFYLDAYHQLIINADSALLQNQQAVTNLSIPGFYIDPVTNRKNKQGIEKDSFFAYSCALAWQLSGNKTYAERALYFLNAWSHINKTYTDADGPLILTYCGSAMVMAAELMHNYTGWQQRDKQQFTIWLKAVYRKAGHEIRNRPNNWADWGRFGTALADYYLDDDKDMAENIRLIKSDLFTKIAPDGHMIEEVKREANGIWYTYFSLAPITGACWITYNATRENIFELKDNNGLGIKSALNYLLYFQQHPAEWPWFKNPRTGSITDNGGLWPVNLMEAMHNIYKDEQFNAFAKPYRPVVYKRHHFVWVYPTLMPVSLTF